MNVRSDYYRQKLHNLLTRITKERVLLFNYSTFENKEEFVLDLISFMLQNLQVRPEIEPKIYWDLSTAVVL